MTLARSLAAALALVVATVTAGVGVTTVAASAADEPSVAVTWPEVTRFNPTRTAYEFTVTDKPEGAHLRYSWGQPDVAPWNVYGTNPVPDSGTATVDPTLLEGSGVVRVWACPEDAWSAACTEAARSPHLEAWSQIHLQPGGSGPRYARSGPSHVEISYSPRAPVTQVPEGTWELLDEHEQPLDPPVVGTLTGDDLVVDGGSGTATVPFVVPDGLPTGAYHVDVRLRVDSEEFGSLEGDLGSGWGGVSIWVDNDAPTLTVRRSSPLLYPVKDDVRDAVYLLAQTSEYTRGSFEVRNAAGDLVFGPKRSTYHDSDPPGERSPAWSGRDNAGRVVPDGEYSLTLSVTDRAGNTAAADARVTVVDKRFRWTTFTRRVRAADNRVGKAYVGRCSTLASPARGGPSGSLGFYSQSRCRGDGDESAVVTHHGMYIPKANRNRYKWVRVTLHGGPASTSASNYIVLGYLGPRADGLVDRKVFRRGNGAHVGPRVAASRVAFDLMTEEPYVLWSSGLTAGSRYNVRGYTVEVRYLEFR